MKVLAIVLVIMILLSGCSVESDCTKMATELRNRVMTSESCSFQAVITADYGDAIFTFQMDCTSDETEDVRFTVTDPETISGISGSVSGDSGAFLFDNAMLVFPVLSEEELTPVVAPWIFMNTLRSGYISSCETTDSGFCIYLDDSFEEDPLRLQIYCNADMMPEGAEIFYHDRRILTLDIQNFQIM